MHTPHTDRRTPRTALSQEGWGTQREARPAAATRSCVRGGAGAGLGAEQEKCCVTDPWKDLYKCCNFPPAGGYKITQGFCRGGPIWPTNKWGSKGGGDAGAGGDPWLCVGGARTQIQCQAECEKNEDCGA